MDLRNKMLSVIADVNANLAEREELTDLIAIALLSRKNLFILGEHPCPDSGEHNLSGAKG